jgi:hypothetical protein
VRFWPALLFVTALAAQDLAPIGIVRGTLLSCDTSHLMLDDDDNHTFKFVTDGRTFIQRDNMRISCAKLKQGEKLEVVSDRSSQRDARYARLVNVMNFERMQRRRVALAPRAPVRRDDPTQRLAPRGALTFSGVVLRLDNTGFLLRTRQEGEKWILFNRDVRYREDGIQVDAASLRSNTRVFVRGGPNWDGEIEAYEVVWGDILMPAAQR